ncbi:MAG TPA: TolC family protein [Longimicrobiales bacterium]
MPRPILPALALAALFASASAGAAQDALSLDEARASADDRSPAVREADARARVGGAGRVESWGRLLPSVRLSAGLDRSGVLQRTAEDPITGGIISLPDSLIEERRSFGTSAMLALDWTVFDGGQNWLAVRGASARAAAAELRLAGVRAQTRASVTIAYLDVLEAEALLEVREAEVSRARTLHEAAETRFRTGAVPEIDLLQASLALNEAELALEDAHIATDAARAGLEAYIGVLADDVVLDAPNAPAVEASALDGVLACVLDLSPEVAALREEVEAAARARSATRWSMLPTVGVGATLVRSEFGQTRDALTTDPRNSQAYYSLNLTWRPLERPAGWLADGRRATAELDEAEAALDAGRARVERDAETAVGRVRRALVVQERGALNVRIAARQREQAAERYRLGLAPITETIQAESLARAAEQQAIVARYGVLRALAELELAAGVDPASCGL